MTIRVALALLLAIATIQGSSTPARARFGVVVSQHAGSSEIGSAVLRDGGSAIDAVVATAFALAVTHPTAGNIGGGGFIVFRPAQGDPVTYDFRETAPARASPSMFVVNGKYDSAIHHDSHISVGTPGPVAGLHLAAISESTGDDVGVPLRAG